MIIDALYNLLASSTELSGLISTYKGFLPAIFTVDPVPEDAEFPYIVLTGAVVQTPYDTKTSQGRQIWVDIRCYSEASGSSITVDAIAETVRGLLHRQSLSGADFSSIWIECEGPIVADDGRSYGRLVTAKITIEEM